jgi:hypothetical protein
MGKGTLKGIDKVVEKIIKDKTTMTAAEFKAMKSIKPKKPSKYRNVKVSIYKNAKVKFIPFGSKSTIGMKGYVKPLSVNQCWKGKRFKTDIYNDYEELLLRNLPDMVIPKPPYGIEFVFGFSSASSDWDNPCKPLQDILQKRYGFNDKLIKQAKVTINKVAKGEEFFEFALYSLS